MPALLPLRPRMSAMESLGEGNNEMIKQHQPQDEGDKLDDSNSTVRTDSSSSSFVRETPTSTSIRTLGRQVSFGHVDIRYYPMELGENPSVSIGPPVQLAWQHGGEETHDLDLFEWERQPKRRQRGRQADMALTHYKRRHILAIAGHSMEEIQAAEKSIHKQQQRRRPLMAMTACVFGRLTAGRSNRKSS